MWRDEITNLIMTEFDNGAAPRQLTLFLVESVATAPPFSPGPPWEKTYRSWRGEFQIIASRQQRKKTEYDIAIEIYDPQGQWQQLVEITTQSLDVALQEFHDTVDHTFNRSGVKPLAPENKTALGHSFGDVEEVGDCDRWNPADFGEVPFQTDGNQVTIFWDSDEPPDPDDFLNLTEFKQAWSEWESARVLERDTQAVQLVSSHSQKSGGDVYDGLRLRPSLVLERDTKNPVPEQKTPGFGDYTDVPEHILPVPEHLHWVEKYCPSNRKDNHYYRYCWKTGTKIKHRHISGGNVRSQLAQSRKEEVEIAIADGQPPSEIEKLIHSWRS
ncbi:hypothetical protein [Nostoc sp. NMS9]|uniref:hypothetical protein n=1 Tax=Nostoc sp. NMS9 TaxID=2815393 RepID=UPI0025FD51D6|nr:hypothetical protein [Nostoc sp. NMS9]